MITKAIPIDTKNSCFIFWETSGDTSISFGAPSTPYYIYNSRHDLTKVSNILVNFRAGKLTDLSDNNTIKLIIDSTTELTKTYTGGTMVESIDWVDVSSYYGMHDVKLYVEGGTDVQVVRRCLLLALGG